MKVYHSKDLYPRVAVAVAKLMKLPVDFVRANPKGPKEDEEAFRSINPNTLAPCLYRKPSLQHHYDRM